MSSAVIALEMFGGVLASTLLKERANVAIH